MNAKLLDQGITGLPLTSLTEAYSVAFSRKWLKQSKPFFLYEVNGK